MLDRYYGHLSKEKIRFRRNHVAISLAKVVGLFERGREDEMRTADSESSTSFSGWIRRLWHIFPSLAACSFLSVGCTPEVYHTRADTETYSALYQKTPGVENVEPADVDIALPDSLDLSGLPKTGGGESFLGAMARYERGAKVLPLDEALDTGITHGREYLGKKEEVFLSALDLTLARYRLAPIFRGSERLAWASDTRTAQVRQGVSDLVSTNTFARTESAGFNWLHRTGAKISADFTRDFLRFTTGNRSVNQSNLAVSIVQPLLEGGGTTVTLEALTQEERDLLYDLRSFADFRRGYIVNLVTDYYGVLQARDQVKNNFVAYQGFLKSVDQEEAFAEEGRATKTEVGRLRQAALQSKSRWINSIRTYQNALDNFKITVGAPVDEIIILDDKELRQLRIEAPDISRAQAVQIALVTRPDLATSADRVADAERQIKVAKNGLLPGLDISMDYRTVSDPGDTTPAINWDRRRWEGAVDLDLPLDRKAERNIYRASLVFLDRAKRADELARDRAKLDINDGFRAIEQAKINFEVAEQQVTLAESRVEEQELRQELGQGDAQDLVDARIDLLNARNQRTSTVIDHALARMRLWRDMGILYVSYDGSWAKRLENESR
jgi:outer membrane protein TolC